MRIHRRALIADLLTSASTLAFSGSAFAQNIGYEYDALGRVTKATYPNGATVTYAYDAAGNRTQVVQVAGTPAGTFWANPTFVDPGGTATLSWTSTDATSASINNGVGAVTPVAGGTVQVTPVSTTTYTLTLTGPNGQTTLQTTVAVGPIPSGTFSANPATIAPGASSTLSWTSTNATTAIIDNGVGNVAPAAGGSVQVSPATTTTYTMVLIGPGGQTALQTTVTISGGFSATIDIQGPGPVNLRTLANGAGYNGAQNAIVVFRVPVSATIRGAAGVADANGGHAIDTGTWPSGSHAISLSLTVDGKVHGGGGGGGTGAGGASGANGKNGGDGIYCQENLVVSVKSGGELKSGGGGGGGGGCWVRTVGGEPTAWNGGGGGGGFANGQGAPEGSGDIDYSSAGASGTTSAGGAGGAGGAGLPATRVNGGGGNGGGPGVAGASGASASGSGGPGSWNANEPGVGGAAGYAVRKNGKTVSVTSSGAVIGTVG